MEGTIGPSAANQMAVAKMPIEQVEDANRGLAAVRPIIPQGVPSAEKKTFLSALQTAFQNTMNIARDNQGEITEMKNDVNQEPELAMASSYFDLSKVSQQLPSPVDTNMGLATEPSVADGSVGEETVGDGTGLSFNTPQELQQILDSNAQNPDFVNQLLEMTPAESQPVVRDSIQRYYEPGKDEADKTILSAEIFKAIHGRGQGEDQVSAEYVQASVERSISEADKLIQQFAKKAASCKTVKKESSSFNLKKQAQAYAGSLHSEFLNFGPSSIRMLPHSNTGVIGSDWHVWIRAKDHSFIMNDHAVDFETFWRGNIMDKYSQPYRNEKGEWVGGYLNKRFETDRNVPEGNNHQLLPGQLRRPYMPEFATMEARLEDSRSKFAKERGYDPTDSEAKAYNWKEASSVKKKVTAESYGVPPIPSINSVKPIGNKKICPICQSDNKSSDTKCTNCGGSLAGVRSQLVPPKPSEPGEQKGQNEHETVRMHVPGMPRAAQSVLPPKMVSLPNKPIKPKRMISDDDVDIVDETHMSNVEHSANHLGL